MDQTAIEETTAPEAAAAKPAPKPKAKPAPAPKAKATPAAPKSMTSLMPKVGGKAKPAKAATPAKAAKPSSGPSVRERVFASLAKAAEGMTGKQVMDKLGLKGIPGLLKDEAICDKPRIKRVTKEGVRGVMYVLTAAGRKDQESGKVNDNAAEGSGGKEWPNGR